MHFMIYKDNGLRKPTPISPGNIKQENVEWYIEYFVNTPPKPPLHTHFLSLPLDF